VDQHPCTADELIRALTELGVEVLVVLHA